MDTFCLEYLLKRVFKVGLTTIDCNRHVFGEEVVGRLLIVPVRHRWFRKCAMCRCRRVYSGMVRCFECQEYLHKDCVSWDGEHREVPQPVSTDRGRTKDASTNTEPADAAVSTAAAQGAAIDADDGGGRGGGDCGDDDRDAATAVSTIAADADKDLATAILSAANGAVRFEPSTAVERGRHVLGTRAPATADRATDNEDRALPAAETATAAATVSPVPRLDVHIDDLNKIHEQWMTRYEQFSKFDQGVMADKVSLYAGAPEVLAKRFADLHKTFNTVMDPFCGAGATAIQLATVCRNVIAMDSDPKNIKLAKHNARVYGVEKNIRFVVHDFNKCAYNFRADAIITTPPLEYCAGEGNMKMAALMRLASVVAPKLLFRLPTYIDTVELHRWGLKQFSQVKFEEVFVDGLMNCINLYLGHTMKTNAYGYRKNAPVKTTTRVLLYNDELTGDRRSNFVKTNDLYSYDLYLRKVEEFLGNHQT